MVNKLGVKVQLQRGARSLLVYPFSPFFFSLARLFRCCWVCRDKLVDPLWVEQVYVHTDYSNACVDRRNFDIMRHGAGRLWQHTGDDFLELSRMRTHFELDCQ